jgi:mannose/fructose/N-acetylgalactosamine-specific phosphotransferase system component IID
MQNLGLLVTLVPWARRRSLEGQERRRFCRRHYDFFNTNPYLANFIIGGLLRLEGSDGLTRQQREEQIRTFKSSLAQSCASLGDQLFWLGLQPALLLLACLLGWLLWPPAAVVLIVLFGLCQGILRWRALLVGYRLGWDIVEVVSLAAWHRAIRLSKRAGMVLAGGVAGYHLAALVAPQGGYGLLCFAVGGGLPLVFRQRIPGEGLLLVALLLALVMTYL